MEPLIMNGLPYYRAIVALDIERSTSRPDPVKAELRNKTYELFDAALCSAGIRERHRDRYIDRGDGLLADYNASLPHSSRPQRELRIRVVMHAGDIHYDANGCFGEALDVAFRLLDAHPVKETLGETADSLTLVISGDIYSSVVRHGYDGIDQHAFHPLVRVQIADKRYPGWIHIPGQTRPTVAICTAPSRGSDSSVTIPDPDFTPGAGQSISASSPTDIWVVGTTVNTTTGTTTAEALHFNGTAWAVVPMQQPGTNTPRSAR